MLYEEISILFSCYEETFRLQQVEYKALSINMSDAHMNLQMLKPYAQSLHGCAPGPLCLDCGFQFSVFMGLLNV